MNRTKTNAASGTPTKSSPNVAIDTLLLGVTIFICNAADQSVPRFIVLSAIPTLPAIHGVIECP